MRRPRSHVRALRPGSSLVRRCSRGPRPEHSLGVVLGEPPVQGGSGCGVAAAATTQVRPQAPAGEPARHP